MSFTLCETLQQLDPFVKLSDGYSVHTAVDWLAILDPSDETEYVLCADLKGRFLIFELDFAGRTIFPPAFVEEKKHAPASLSPAFRPELFPHVYT